MFSTCRETGRRRTHLHQYENGIVSAIVPCQKTTVFGHGPTEKEYVVPENVKIWARLLYSVSSAILRSAVTDDQVQFAQNVLLTSLRGLLRSHVVGIWPLHLF